MHVGLLSSESTRHVHLLHMHQHTDQQQPLPSRPTPPHTLPAHHHHHHHPFSTTTPFPPPPFFHHNPFPPPPSPAASPQSHECQLFIKGLPHQATEDALYTLVQPYETVVTRVHVATQDHADGSRFGFVTFATQEDAARALQELNGRDLQVRCVVWGGCCGAGCIVGRV